MSNLNKSLDEIIAEKAKMLPKKSKQAKNAPKAKGEKGGNQSRKNTSAIAQKAARRQQIQQARGNAPVKIKSAKQLVHEARKSNTQKSSTKGAKQQGTKDSRKLENIQITINLGGSSKKGAQSNQPKKQKNNNKKPGIRLL
jgi:hypothetical protein